MRPAALEIAANKRLSIMIRIHSKHCQFYVTKMLCVFVMRVFGCLELISSHCFISLGCPRIPSQFASDIHILPLRITLLCKFIYNVIDM